MRWRMFGCVSALPGLGPIAAATLILRVLRGHQEEAFAVTQAYAKSKHPAKAALRRVT